MSNSPRCVCKSDQLALLVRPAFGERRLYQCRNCSTVQLYPFPAPAGQVASIYQSESYLSSISEDEYRGYYTVLEEYLRKDAGLGRDVRILDFGAGKCYYQKFFLEDGYREVNSIEINLHAVRYARERLGLQDIFESAEDLPHDYYDIVISNQVFEHLENPIEILEGIIAPVLRPGGMVCFSVPNWKSASRLILGSRWIGYSPEDHIWFFSEESIRKVMVDSGKFSLEQTCVRSAVGRPYDRFRPRGIVRKLAYSLVMKNAERLGKGDQMIVLVRKR